MNAGTKIKNIDKFSKLNLFEMISKIQRRPVYCAYSNGKHFKNIYHRLAKFRRPLKIFFIVCLKCLIKLKPISNIFVNFTEFMSILLPH